MPIIRRVLTSVLIVGICVITTGAAKQPLTLTEEEAEWIGNKIFFNECGGQDENLVSWNKGEDFMSLGIGHFIWYPAGSRGPFDESFPALLKFIKQRGSELPVWLDEQKEPNCPWKSRQEFLRDLQDPKARDLKKFIARTKALQLIFIVNRLQSALPKMLSVAPEGSRSHIEEQFYRMARSPSGMYALVDYVNFKGEGILATERYEGQGWGLLQVLERMQGTKGGPQAIREFVQSAEEVLTERVKNSPPERDEQRWLRGWKNRLATYAIY